MPEFEYIVGKTYYKINRTFADLFLDNDYRMHKYEITRVGKRDVWAIDRSYKRIDMQIERGHNQKHLRAYPSIEEAISTYKSELIYKILNAERSVCSAKEDLDRFCQEFPQTA